LAGAPIMALAAQPDQVGRIEPAMWRSLDTFNVVALGCQLQEAGLKAVATEPIR